MARPARSAAVAEASGLVLPAGSRERPEGAAIPVVEAEEVEEGEWRAVAAVGEVTGRRPVLELVQAQGAEGTGWQETLGSLGHWTRCCRKESRQLSPPCCQRRCQVQDRSPVWAGAECSASSSSAAALRDWPRLPTNLNPRLNHLFVEISSWGCESWVGERPSSTLGLGRL